MKYLHAAIDHKYSSPGLVLYSVAIDSKRLCNLFHFLVGAALTFFPTANSVLSLRERNYCERENVIRKNIVEKMSREKLSREKMENML